MGMFLPPVGEGDVWLNDQEGTQPRANISFASIGAWYRTMANAGFLDLSCALVGGAPAASSLRGHHLTPSHWQHAPSRSPSPPPPLFRL